MLEKIINNYWEFRMYKSNELRNEDIFKVLF